MKVYINQELDNHKDKIISTFKNLFEIAGVKITFVENLIDADVIYSNFKINDKLTIKSISQSEWNSILKMSKFVNYNSYKVPDYFINKNYRLV
jgi:hypothetical protein